VKMIIYKDIFTGDELFTDSFPLKCVDGTYFEVEGERVTEKTEIDERSIGGNKSAEATELDESSDPSVVTGINIILTHRLKETFIFDRKTYFSGFFKPYLKRIVEKLKKDDPDKVAAFQERMK
uniref:hypothetical protein n=1 Tax=Salmonella sp. s55004 TaxID=3159675 RepID=UPI00397EBFB8